MAYSGDKEYITASTSGAVQHYRFVKSESGNVVLCGLGESALGVSLSTPEHDNEEATVVVRGLCKIETGASFAAGVHLSSDSDGRAVVSQSGGTMLGTALEKSNAPGEIIKAIYHKKGACACPLFKVPEDTVPPEIQLFIAYVGEGYLVVTWGDGSYNIMASGQSMLWTHDYGTPGVYPVNVIATDISSISNMTITGQNVEGNLAHFVPYMGELEFFDLSENQFTGNIANLKNLPVTLDTVQVNGNTGLSYTSDGDLPAWDNADIQLGDCDLTTNEVDNILIDLAAGGGVSSELGIAGSNEARSSASDAAMSTLTTNSWTVTVNE